MNAFLRIERFLSTQKRVRLCNKTQHEELILLDTGQVQRTSNGAVYASPFDAITSIMKEMRVVYYE